MKTYTCGICGASITEEIEASISYWVDDDGDSLSYAPSLHDHAPGDEPRPALTPEQHEAVLAALDGDLALWAGQCHAASFAIVKAGVFPVARVARGTARGVTSQHSWVVVSADAYDRDAMIVDPTLWSYNPNVSGVWVGTYRDDVHYPKGRWDSIWDHGRPPYPVEEPIEIVEPEGGWSDRARDFLDLVGPLDIRGWMALGSGCVHGWPAGEIIAAMEATPRLGGLAAIDYVGMLTDRNPGGLYLPDDWSPPEPAPRLIPVITFDECGEDRDAPEHICVDEDGWIAFHHRPRNDPFPDGKTEHDLSHRYEYLVSRIGSEVTP